MIAAFLTGDHGRGPTMACPALESSRAVCAGSDLSGSLEEREGWSWNDGMEGQL